jgi:hypothetical protein
MVVNYVPLERRKIRIKKPFPATIAVVWKIELTLYQDFILRNADRRTFTL